MRAGVFLVVGALLVPIVASCGKSEPPEYSATLPSAEEALTSEAVPDWAAGYTFTHHHGDINWFHFSPDGTVYGRYEGGDVGEDYCEHARIEAGHLRAHSIVLVATSAHSGLAKPYLTRTADNRYFVHVDEGFVEYQRANLCGRDGGGCGGYGRVEACDATELAERSKAWNACLAEASRDAMAVSTPTS